MSALVQGVRRKLEQVNPWAGTPAVVTCGGCIALSPPSLHTCLPPRPPTDTITAVIAASGSTDDGDLVGSDLQGVLQYLSTLPSNAPPAIAAVVSAARAALPALNASVVHFAKNVRAAPNVGWCPDREGRGGETVFST